jgi:mono/diheme cytochrome c family protein
MRMRKAYGRAQGGYRLCDETFGEGAGGIKIAVPETLPGHYRPEHEEINKMVRSATAFGFAALLIGAPAWAQQQDLVAKGQAVYSAQKCSMCHSIAGKGQAKGPLDDVGGRLKADDIREWIVDPAKMTKEHNATRKPAMRAYSNLPKEDLEALVAYISSLKKK